MEALGNWKSSYSWPIEWNVNWQSKNGFPPGLAQRVLQPNKMRISPDLSQGLITSSDTSTTLFAQNSLLQNFQNFAELLSSLHAQKLFDWRPATSILPHRRHCGKFWHGWIKLTLHMPFTVYVLSIPVHYQSLPDDCAVAAEEAAANRHEAAWASLQSTIQWVSNHEALIPWKGILLKPPSVHLPLPGRWDIQAGLFSSKEHLKRSEGNKHLPRKNEKPSVLLATSFCLYRIFRDLPIDSTAESQMSQGCGHHFPSHIAHGLPKVKRTNPSTKGSDIINGILH